MLQPLKGHYQGVRTVSHVHIYAYLKYKCAYTVRRYVGRLRCQKSVSFVVEGSDV